MRIGIQLPYPAFTMSSADSALLAKTAEGRRFAIQLTPCARSGGACGSKV
jgi:hypothetical protein